jgi:RING-box protein 1
MMFEIKEWDTVVSWSFGGAGAHAQNLPCMMCRRMLNEASTQYEENPCEERADGKVLATGECGHSFHLDCIDIWRRGQAGGTCPSCSAHWQTAHTAPIAV